MAWKLVNPNITNDPSYLDPRLSDDESKISSNTTSLAQKAQQSDLNGLMTVNLKVTNSNDITQDLINAITTINNNGGGILNIPYVSSGYTVNTANINLCNNLIIKGNGTTLHFTSSTSVKYGFIINGLNNITIKDLNLVSTDDYARVDGRTGNSSNVYGISITGNDIKFENMYAEQLLTLFWINNTTTSYRLKADNIKTYRVKQPLFMRYVQDSSFNNLNFDCVDSSSYDHHIYMNGDNNNIRFNNLLFQNGIATSPAISLKIDSGTVADYSTNIYFNDVTIKNVSGIYTSSSKNIYVSNYHVFGNGVANTWGVNLDVNTSDFFLSNFSIDNVSLPFSVTACDTAIISKGIVTNGGSNYVTLVSLTNFIFDNVMFYGNPAATSTTIGYSNTNGTNNGTFKNCRFIYSSTPANYAMSFRGNDNIIFDNCQFWNNGGTAFGYISYNLTPAKVTAKNNYYHGFTTFKNNFDTATTEYTNISV